ncbi:hypothetical protein [Methylobacterium radiodurans]|uniref:Uncharacterized protein n=1 Tax=Methylobacterium radiodurans TaxID=2202828 RepID=A0A2U8VTH3_9HYPH|nr:hypothetical protein [Methylobacterium radiodurans]AWN37074.1 hypothetical protein DK427_16165 [Methylobacterium radiodurans]
MAPGYEIALWLEGLGLAGLAVGIWRLRVEEAARVRALRSVLRSGPDPRIVPSPRPRADRTRMVLRTVEPSCPGGRVETVPSAAAHALARAFMREA